MNTANTLNDLEKIFERAVKNHQNGRLDEACQCYKLILEQVPDSPLVNYNLGLALFQQENYQESYSYYQTALRHEPEDLDILYNLALCTKRLGKYNQTVRIYEMILEKKPDDIDSLYNLGCCIKDINNDIKAIEIFHQVLELYPCHQSAMNNLAFLYHTNGDLENAGKMYKKLLKINPEDYQAKHMLAALQGECSLTAPLPYVEQMFDSYSSYYEDSLVQKLGYNVPEIMRKFFSDTFPKSSMQRKVLDLGCGTGLAGVVFKDLSSALTGIDISNKMIDKAAAKGVYDSLINTGIVEYLENHPLPYDLYIAADVFTYIGDLESIFDTIARNSAPEAIFCFSTEKSDTDSFELRNTGRFAHSQKYIETITLLTGWKIIRTIDIDLRKEKELWIDGMLYFLVKSNFNQR